jgi:ribosomal protein S18 acetylase RimI-like enzyme
MANNIGIRRFQESDRAFILTLSPRLAEVAGLAWHTDSVIQKMQDAYITEMLDQTSVPQIILIAENDGRALGFIHVCEHKDDISEELCGTVTLLAVSPNTQGMGIGKLLMAAAENWAKEQGYRLLHLEVFANNEKARGFYQNIGFEAEMLHMIKPL